MFLRSTYFPFSPTEPRHEALVHFKIFGNASFINPAFLTRFGCLWSSAHAIIESQSNCGQTSQTSVRLIFVSWNKYNCSSWPWQYYYKELLLELRLGVVRVCWCRSTACERKQGVWPSWAPSRLPLVLAVTVKVCNLCNPPYIPTYWYPLLPNVYIFILTPHSSIG